MVSVFKRRDCNSWIVSWFGHTGKRRERSSHTTDKRAAKRIAAKLEADVALRREGVVDAGQEQHREAESAPLIDHLSNYLRHCQSTGQASRFVAQKRNRLERLLQAASMSLLSDLTAEAVDGFLRLLRDQGLSRRTMDSYLQDAKAFGTWCVRRGRLESNPLAVFQRVDESPDRSRRLSLSKSEVASLFRVADERERGLRYRAAFYAGLRPSNLLRMTWGDVDLEGRVLVSRGGKAKREDLESLHPELTVELQRS